MRRESVTGDKYVRGTRSRPGSGGSCERRIREARGSPADPLLDTVGRYAAAHVAFAVDDLAAVMVDAERAGLSFIGSPPEEGLGPYRRAFVAPETHVGIPFEFVEPY